MLTQEDGSRWSRGIRSAGIVFHTQPRNLQSSTGIHEVNRIMLVHRIFEVSRSTRPHMVTKSWRSVNKSVSGKHIIIISCKGTIENFSPSSHIPSNNEVPGYPSHIKRKVKKANGLETTTSQGRRHGPGATVDDQHSGHLLRATWVTLSVSLHSICHCQVCAYREKGPLMSSFHSAVCGPVSSSTADTAKEKQGQGRR